MSLSQLVIILGIFSLQLLTVACESEETNINTNETVEIDTCLVDNSSFFRQQVEFYTLFPYKFRVTPAQFETIPVELVKKEAGTSNSTYVIDTLEVTRKSGYTFVNVISNVDSIDFRYNYCSGEVSHLFCVDSLSYFASYELEFISASKEIFSYERLSAYIPAGDIIFTHIGTMKSQ